ncbi:rRNA maturation RNase YbeY [Candidatus Parcubacteria bacterium]|nr:rRNA maturation RNase YbeY [Candidatus Parcubacteria bacterium]
MRYILDDENLNVSYTTKKAPKITGVFLRMVKDTILGKKYDLSIYFVGQDKILSINKRYRKKDYVTDILSFHYENFGEMYICLDKVEQKAKLFNTTTENYLNYLFIHGMTHLLGHDHGDLMDKLEKKFTKKLNIFYPY